ncbi:hypothetical protein ColTof3_12665 [Colletotrichum tofieldiae]|nr:hypothetical protein ColTof3_12665 [Colletotrichum tofieldiae]GKT92597.1 hypothetical protein Ct61P_10447 [Colletotrichum tofieldiae]
MTITAVTQLPIDVKSDEIDYADPDTMLTRDIDFASNLGPSFDLPLGIKLELGRRLARWAAEEYWPWYKKAVLKLGRLAPPAADGDGDQARAGHKMKVLVALTLRTCSAGHVSVTSKFAE